ncbi:hypothetical protein O9929_27860 [Vibrio lentus]|nr:hypothetical protein [Vibrio lentus]
MRWCFERAVMSLSQQRNCRGGEFVSQVNNLPTLERTSPFSYGIEVTCQEDFQQALDKSDKAMYEMKKRSVQSMLALNLQ